MKNKRFLISLLAAAFVSINAALLVTPQKVFAADGKWLDKTTIEMGGVRYIDGKPDDSTLDYYKDGKDSADKGCSEVIRNFNGDKTQAKLYQLEKGLGCAVKGSGTTVNLTEAAPGSSSGVPTGSETPGGGDNRPDCESTGFNLSWIFCPLIEGLANTADGIFNNIVRPLLVTATIDPNDTNAPVFKIWSAFRTIGNIMLVIGLLIIVFGQSIGGGMVDAYTAKKALPRILLTAVLINLSIYIVAAAVDVTNILGAGLAQLITAPLGGAGHYNLKLGNSTQTVGALGIAAMVKGLFVVGIGPIAAFFALFILLPALIAMLGVMITLLLRRGIIMALIIIAPFAFALYCLPNTEKYFKKWWEFLFKALLVYPIIVVVFAVSDVMAVTMNLSARNSGLAATFAQFISILLLILPLFLIPFSFKLAGGALGTLVGTLTGWGKQGGAFIKGNPNDPNSLQNTVRRNAGAQFTKARAQYVRRNANNAHGRTRAFLARRANYGNILDKEADINEDAQKRVGRTTGSGDDTYVRARTSLALYRREDGGETVNAAEAAKDNDGHLMRVTDKNGNAMRTSLNGQKRFTDYDYDKASQILRTPGELQEAINYEAKKTLTNEDTDYFLKNFVPWAEQEGLEYEQAKGLYTGVAFARQNERLELKHSAIKERADGPGYQLVTAANNIDTKINKDTGELQQITGRDAFIQELYDKKGTWAISQMHDSTINTTAKAKDAYAADIKNLASRTDLNPEERTKLQLSRNQLRKIQEMEDSWVGTGRAGALPQMVQAPGEEGPTPAYTGLSSAAEGVQQAAKRMAFRQATMADGSTRTVRNKYDMNGERVLESGEVYGPPPPRG